MDKRSVTRREKERKRCIFEIELFYGSPMALEFLSDCNKTVDAERFPLPGARKGNDLRRKKQNTSSPEYMRFCLEDPSIILTETQRMLPWRASKHLHDEPGNLVQLCNEMIWLQKT